MSLDAGQSKTIRLRMKAKTGETDTKFGLFAEDVESGAQVDAVYVFLDVPPFA